MIVVIRSVLHGCRTQLLNQVVISQNRTVDVLWHSQQEILSAVIYYM